MLPDSTFIKLIELNDLLLELACDGNELGLSAKEMDRFNTLNDDLSDLLADIALSE